MVCGWLGLRRVRIGATSSQEAGAAVNGPPLRRIKGHRCLLSALRALHRDFDALTDSGRLSRRDRRQSLVLCLLAGLTTLGFVLQSLIVKEDLLAARPDKVVTAIDAFYRSICKLAVGPTLIRGCFHRHRRDFYWVHHDLLAPLGTFSQRFMRSRLLIHDSSLCLIESCCRNFLRNRGCKPLTAVIFVGKSIAMSKLCQDQTSELPLLGRCRRSDLLPTSGMPVAN